MSELGLKIRASLITAVYRHTLSVSGIKMRAFSMGEIVNYMSTDVDRIVNFCPSLHAAWSLPFQLVVTMGLLFQQLGLSCLAGLAVAVVMVPVNMVIAKSIGRMSTKMMSAKDERGAVSKAF